MERPARPAGVGKECRHCRHFDTITNLQGSFNLCRKNAPGAQGMVVGMQQGKDPGTGLPTNNPVWAYTTLWPSVAATDWCSEFSRLQEVPK